MMGPLKKNLTPIGKGGIQVHKGKGAAPFPPQPKPGPLTQAAPSMNNYAKSTPLPMAPPPTTPSLGGDGSPGQSQGMI